MPSPFQSHSQVMGVTSFVPLEALPSKETTVFVATGLVGEVAGRYV
jgi:hypothetical protein